MNNRFMLAPLTNCQSHDDGVMSAEEFRWLTLRAQGGFGLTMTCAAHVQAQGRGFPGQLGVFTDAHLEGLSKLAAAIKREGSMAVIQLHHAGMRSPAALIGATPVCPSDNAETGARALTPPEIDQLIEDFIAAAQRAERAGFDGVEVHCAHGYILGQFLSGEVNHRTDEYGGTLKNRARIIIKIIAGIRERCRADFNVGVRFSPERFGMNVREVREVVQRLMREAAVDYVDMSLWDAFKEPEDEALRGRGLFSYFTELDRGTVRLGVAGMINSAATARRIMDAGADFVIAGRSGILHHDFPQRVQADPQFETIALPVTPDYLHGEGVSDAFVDYLRKRKGFVAG